MIDLGDGLRIEVGDDDARAANIDDAIASAILIDGRSLMRDRIFDAADEMQRPRKERRREHRNRRQRSKRCDEPPPDPHKGGSHESTPYLVVEQDPRLKNGNAR